MLHRCRFARTTSFASAARVRANGVELLIGRVNRAEGT
ncbi:hypothetical protein LA76x_4107 [Lysobacter antibioticus]|uniref:Uncharacterized protein n=1 Tax=Lysobacter antibioticus TaxID=84531 RepID=A0A0S2FFB6_LYSAN|nr:hypothetical protein LA76x_4107 [Lysobacter antibioticus]